MKTNLFDVSLRLQKFSRIQSYSFQLKEHTKFMSCLPGASMNYFIRNKLTYISCSMPPHYTHLLYQLLLTMFYRTWTDSSVSVFSSGDVMVWCRGRVQEGCWRLHYIPQFLVKLGSWLERLNTP